MRALPILGIFMGLIACAPPSTTPPDLGSGSHSAKAQALPTEAESSAAPDVELVVGAMSSVPPRDWPCSFEESLRDGGGLLEIELDYGGPESCMLPADIAASGVVGCPTTLTAFRLGSDDPRFVMRYGYDDRGRLITVRDGEAAPDEYRWDTERLIHVHRSDRTYTATDEGFHVIDDGELSVEAKMAGDLPVWIERHYSTMSQTLVQTLRWEGTRLLEIDSGGDILVPSYDCR